MEKSTWRLFVTVNGPRCVDGSWPPSLTRYLPVIRWRYASRRHREVALCHGALFRFVCSLASINHVLSLPHPQFRAPRRCNPAPFSFLHRIFRPPPPLLHGVARSLHRKWVHPPLPEKRAEIRRCVEDEFGEDEIFRFCLRYTLRKRGRDECRV